VTAVDVDPRRTTKPEARPVPRAGRVAQLDASIWLRRDQIGFLRHALGRYGDIFSLRVLGMPLIMVNHPDYVQRVLVDNHANYDKDSLLYRVVRPVLRDGLIGAVGGDSWHRQRRLMQPSFHRPNVAVFASNMTDETDTMLDRWDRSVDDDGVVDFTAELGHLALRIVTRTLFGADVGESTEAIEADFTVANQIMGAFFRFPFPPLSWPTPSHRRLRALIGNLDAFIDELVRQRADRTESRHDLLSVLGAAVDQDTGYRMTAEQLHHEVLNIMVGGYETTTHTLGWMFYQVARNPEVLQRIQEEADAVLGGRPPTFDDLLSLPYSRRVVDETLRMNSAAWQTMRHAIDDDVIGGHHIPAGSGIYINILTLHRHPEYWPDPDTFDPDRFLPAAIAGRPRNSYLPFGLGPRNCIGKHFALTELHLVLVMILQRYDLRLPAGVTTIPMQPMVTLRPKGGVHMHVRRR
jgi:cytochrome P450